MIQIQNVFPRESLVMNLIGFSELNKFFGVLSIFR